MRIVEGIWYHYIIKRVLSYGYSKIMWMISLVKCRSSVLSDANRGRNMVSLYNKTGSKLRIFQNHVDDFKSSESRVSSPA
jgi:hypothetical protein